MCFAKPLEKVVPLLVKFSTFNEQNFVEVLFRESLKQRNG